jgi:hypothetical protein
MMSMLNKEQNLPKEICKHKRFSNNNNSELCLKVKGVKCNKDGKLLVQVDKIMIQTLSKTYKIIFPSLHIKSLI